MKPWKIIYLATYPPRECGIATFTKDVSDSVHRKYGSIALPRIIAMQEENAKARCYGRNVIFTINEANKEDYAEAAKKINSIKDADVLNIQHEFGIFGGEYGEYLIELMEKVTKKIVTTMHTVIDEPNEKMMKIVKAIAEMSDKIVVMTYNAKELLVNIYGVDAEKIEVIHHGTPNISLNNGRRETREKLGVENCKLILTFGMLSRGKGAEYAIKAMPFILKKHPEAVYMLVGQTHPKVKEREGESYREELKQLVKELKLEKAVKFVDRYLDLDEIIDYLKAADIYFATTIDPKQVCSGTVSYAMAAGKPIVASRNKYNEEMLANGRGIMLEENVPERFAEEAIKLLDDSAYRDSVQKMAYEYSRKMVWSNVATRYYALFRSLGKRKEPYFSILPKIDFRHFHEMCDDFGMIQFSDYSRPLRESGYTLDDNARALVVAVKAWDLMKNRRMLKEASKFMQFIEYCQRDDYWFHNKLNEKKEFVDDIGSEDSYGRALCALGAVLNSTLPEKIRENAKKVFSKAAVRAQEIKAPRSQAKAIIGLLKAKDAVEVNDEIIKGLLDSLISKYHENADDDWKWFEGSLTYANASIPKALFEAGAYFNDEKAMKIAEQSLEFLTNTHFEEGKLKPVGQNGWFVKGGKKALYDQQPIEAGEMTKTYLKAFEITKEKKYLDRARDSFEWFLGRNSMELNAYDDSTGGCFDGITENGLNLNQGAESTLVYLDARLSLEKVLGKIKN